MIRLLCSNLGGLGSSSAFAQIVSRCGNPAYTALTTPVPQIGIPLREDVFLVDLIIVIPITIIHCIT